MNPVEPMLLVGGPLHGNWIAVEAREGSVQHIPSIPPLTAIWGANDPRLESLTITAHEYKITKIRGRMILLFNGVA